MRTSSETKWNFPPLVPQTTSEAGGLSWGGGICSFCFGKSGCQSKLAFPFFQKHLRSENVPCVCVCGCTHVHVREQEYVYMCVSVCVSSLGNRRTNVLVCSQFFGTHEADHPPHPRRCYNHHGPSSVLENMWLASRVEVSGNREGAEPPVNWPSPPRPRSCEPPLPRLGPYPL